MCAFWTDQSSSLLNRSQSSTPQSLYLTINSGFQKKQNKTNNSNKNVQLWRQGAENWLAVNWEMCHKWIIKEISWDVSDTLYRDQFNPPDMRQRPECLLCRRLASRSASLSNLKLNVLLRLFFFHLRSSGKGCLRSGSEWGYMWDMKESGTGAERYIRHEKRVQVGDTEEGAGISTAAESRGLPTAYVVGPQATTARLSPFTLSWLLKSASGH